MYQKQVDPFYKSQRWKKLRAKVMRRDGYQCQMSKRYGKNVPAEMVHHIFPREDYPEYEWCAWNLISLSNAEHNKLHDMETNALTRRGMDLLDRTKRKMQAEGKWIAQDPAPSE